MPFFFNKSLISLDHKILDSIFPLRLRYFQSQSRHSVSDIPSFVGEFHFTSQSKNLCLGVSKSGIHHHGCASQDDLIIISKSE